MFSFQFATKKVLFKFSLTPIVFEIFQKTPKGQYVDITFQNMPLGEDDGLLVSLEPLFGPPKLVIDLDFSQSQNLAEFRQTACTRVPEQEEGHFSFSYIKNS